MIHLNKNQYTALRAFTTIVRQELMKGLNKQISHSTILLGQEYGFCNDEIREIVENCYKNLVGMR